MAWRRQLELYFKASISNLSFVFDLFLRYDSRELFCERNKHISQISSIRLYWSLDLFYFMISIGTNECVSHKLYNRHPGISEQEYFANFAIFSGNGLSNPQQLQPQPPLPNMIISILIKIGQTFDEGICCIIGESASLFESWMWAASLPVTVINSYRCQWL